MHLKNTTHMTKNKVFLFTHTDLDGISCKIVANAYFEEYRSFACNYEEVADVMRKELFSLKNPTKETVTVLMSDLSYPQECKDITEWLNNNCTLVVADHHKTSMWLRDELTTPYMLVESDGDRCGAVLLNQALKCSGFDRNERIILSRFNEFLEYVNRWDTWLWTKPGYFKTELGENKPLVVCNALFALGEERFIFTIERYLYGICNSMFMGDIKKEIRKYNRSQIKTINDVVDDYRTGSVESESYGHLRFVCLNDGNHYQSMIGLLASHRYKHLVPDFILVLEDERASMRSPKPGIDLSVLSKEFGGGGHVEAAGIYWKDYKDKFLINNPWPNTPCYEQQEEITVA